MTGRDTPPRDALFARAAAWVARMDRAPLCAADQARLRHWLAADIRRRGALVRAQALWLKAAAAAARAVASVSAAGSSDQRPPSAGGRGGAAAAGRPSACPR